jgi:ATP-dependent exoDNAse (exonuclease V) beta subunit
MPAPAAAPAGVTVVEMPRPAERPFGPRFGTLVHATLATVDLDADAGTVHRTAETQARILLASADEVSAAADAVSSILSRPLFDRVRAAAAKGLCSRECPILWRAPDGSLVEGTVDVVFEEDDALTILDFKTDRGPSEVKAEYERQLALYCRAFAALRKRPVAGILVKV